MKSRPSNLRNLDHLSEDILSYLNNTDRAAIIRMFETIKYNFNSYSNKLKSLTSGYYSYRLNEISNIIKELKTLQVHAKKHHPILINRCWLSWIVKFFENAKYRDTYNEWNNESSPSVLCMQLILAQLKSYNHKDPLHLGREFTSLYEAFQEKAEQEDRRYEKAEMEYKQKQLELKSIKRGQLTLKLNDVKKSYQPEVAPKKLNFDKPELRRIRNSLFVVLANRPLVPTKTEETTAGLLKELPFTQCENLYFLNKNPVRFKKPAGVDGVKTPQDFFAELRESKKFRELKDLAEPEVLMPSLRQ